mgnify:CR=1 FL=1
MLCSGYSCKLCCRLAMNQRVEPHPQTQTRARARASTTLTCGSRLQVHMRRSTVVADNGSSVLDDYRTSYGTFINRWGGGERQGLKGGIHYTGEGSCKGAVGAAT